MPAILRDSAAVFVHGLFSSSSVWTPLLKYIQEDAVIAGGFHLAPFSYDTPSVHHRIKNRIPHLHDVAEQLRTWILSTPEVRDARRLVLVGHSLGGLVIQRYLADRLASGAAVELQRIRAVVLFGTPNTGSQYLLLARRFFGTLWKHPQERSTRPFDEEVERIRCIILEQCVYATEVSESRCPIPFHVFAGASDGVVTPTSARWVFPNAGTLEGNHSSMLRPASINAPICQSLHRILIQARDSFPPDRLNLSTEVLDITNVRDIDAVVQLQHERFPPAAYMFADDLRYCMKSYEQTWGVRPKALLARLNGRVIGFSLFSETERSLVAGYLAVARGAPSKIVTEAILNQIGRRSRELGDLPIIFEVRNPECSDEPEEDTARIKLFQRYGAKILASVRFLVPDMEHFPNPGAEEQYLIMYGRPGGLPRDLARGEVQIIVYDLYNIFYRFWFSRHVPEDRMAQYFADLTSRVMQPIPDRVSLTTM